MKIAILTSKKLETTSELVADWLVSFGVDVTRINAEDLDIDAVCINNSNNISNNHSLINLEYDVLWFRRWKKDESYSSFISKKFKGMTSEMFFIIASSIKNDYKIVQSSILSSFKAKKIFSNLKQLTVNKIKVLDIAVEIGLTIPSSIITDNKISLQKFASNQNNGIIVKDLDYPFYTHKKDEMYCIYVNSLDDFSKIPPKFPLSFFQEKIEKEFEIRIFYLDGECFSMAIFSQEDEQTSIDFRRYNHIQPNRTIPYKLPLNIELKINKLMKKLTLETGSIDMIKSTNSDFVFLEVNPVGQFGMTSYPCNYKLEKRVAEHLFNLADEK